MRDEQKRDEQKSKTQLIAELQALRQQITDLEATVAERQPLAAALQASESRYRQIFESNQAIKLIIDPTDGRITDANEAACRFYGYDIQTLTSLRITDINMLSEVAVKQEMERAKTEKRLFFNFRHRLASGEIRNVEVYSGPVETAQGTLLYSIIHDVTARHRAEAELRQSQANLSALIENTDGSIWSVDRDYRLIVSNSANQQRIRQAFGRSFAAGDFVLIEDIPPDVREEWRGYYDCALRGEQFNIEVRQRVVDTQHHVEYRFSPIWAADGSVTGVTVFGRDVTERKQTEQALQEAEWCYRMAADFTYDWEIWENPDGTFRYVSPACERLTGYTVQEFMADPTLFNRIIVPEDREEWRHHRHDVIETSGPYEIQFRIRRRDGRAAWIEHACHPVRDDSGTFLGYRASNRDITERKQTEKALRESRTLLQQVIDLSPYPIFAKDAAGRFLLVNRAGAQFGGLSPEEMIGRLEATWVADEEVLRQIQVADRQVIEAGGVTIFPEEVFVDAQGQERIMQTAKAPLRHKQDEAPGVLGISIDITERKRAEEALLARTRELTLLNDTGRAFVSSLELDQVLITVLDQVRQIIGIVACSIWLVDPESGDLVCREVASPRDELVRGQRLAVGQGLIGWVVQRGESLNIPDITKDSRHFKGVDDLTGLKARAILTVPLQTKNESLGALQLIDEAENRFSPSDVRLAESLAALATIAIDNARLYRQTQADATAKALLLREVNHRVKNNLAAISGMLYVEKRHAQQTTTQRAYTAIMDDLINRVRGLTKVHQLLSAANWSPLPLSDLTGQIIKSALQALPSDKEIGVEIVEAAPVVVTPKEAHNLALAINELATNVVKYAAPAQERTQIRVDIEPGGDERTVLLTFRDDGPGFPPEVLQAQERNVGLYLIENTVCHSLRGDVTLRNDNGAVAVLRFVSDLG